MDAQHSLLNNHGGQTRNYVKAMLTNSQRYEISEEILMYDVLEIHVSFFINKNKVGYLQCVHNQIISSCCCGCYCCCFSYCL